jgi:hypothetical protein
MTNHHTHDGFEAPPESAERFGESGEINTEWITKLIGAGFDTCQPCQSEALTHLADDPLATTRLVELACVATHSALGGLPANMTDSRAPGVSGKHFRAAARSGLDGNTRAMFETVRAMAGPARTEAANDAADLLVGHLMMGPQR